MKEICHQYTCYEEREQQCFFSACRIGPQNTPHILRKKIRGSDRGLCVPDLCFRIVLSKHQFLHKREKGLKGSPSLAHSLSQPAPVAITKYHKWRELKQQRVIFSQFWILWVGDRGTHGAVGQVPGQGPLPGFSVAAHIVSSYGRERVLLSLPLFIRALFPPWEPHPHHLI